MTGEPNYSAMSAEIYSKTLTHCGFCVKAKALLEKFGIPYREISVEENRDECFARVNEATGADPKTAPQIFIDEKYIGGHAELVKWLH
jgi:glutaredoxin 3